MKGLFFFIGSFLRWLVKDPRQSFLLLTYFATLHGLGVLFEFNSSGGLGLVFTVAFLVPIFMLIGQGLPTDCLNVKEQIKREEASCAKQLKTF